jgi:hypothetical protein
LFVGRVLGCKGRRRTQDHNDRNDKRDDESDATTEGVPVGGPGLMRGLVGVGPLLLRIRWVCGGACGLLWGV